MSCSSNTLIIGRPTQQKYDSLCSSGDIKASFGGGGGCTGSGTPACNSPVAPHDRRLSPRKSREKVREDLKDYVLLMLGAPSIKIELDQQNLDLAVDNAMKIFEEYAGREHFSYYTFRTVPGKSVYKMPDDIGIIRNVFYKQSPNFAFQSSDLDGSIPVEYFYPGGSYSSIQGGMIDPVQPIWGRMGEWVLYKQYEQMFTNISGNTGGWEWVSDTSTVKLYPTPCRGQLVIVHYMQKCKDWKEVNQAMQEGAYAFALIMLGNIRGKYTQIPGPGGGMQLDGEYQRNKGYELLEKWKEDLIYKYSDILPITMH